MTRTKQLHLDVLLTDAYTDKAVRHARLPINAETAFHIFEVDKRLLVELNTYEQSYYPSLIQRVGSDLECHLKHESFDLIRLSLGDKHASNLWKMLQELLGKLRSDAPVIDGQSEILV